MKPYLYICIVFILISCSSNSNVTQRCIVLSVGNLEYNKMIELFPATTLIDTNRYKSVKIYDYQFRKNGKVKDSILLGHQNLFVDRNYIQDIIYEVEYDSLHRYSKRYATRITTNTKYLNDEKLYNYDGNITDWIIYTREGELYAKTLYTYDSITKLLTSEERYSYYPFKVPKLSKRKEYEYKKRSLVKETEYSFSPKSKLTKVYNAKGENIDYLSETFEQEKRTYYWGFRSFYKNNKLCKEEHYGSDRLKIVTNYKYDAHNMPIEQLSYNQFNTKPTYLLRFYYSDQKVVNEINPY